jgi:hypothetical protein
LASIVITYWRDIPAQVTAKEGRITARRELSLRFTEAIDVAAMRSGAAGTDEYLSEWRRGEPIGCGADLEAEVAAAAAKIEADYDKERLVALAKNGGREEA